MFAACHKTLTRGFLAARGCPCANEETERLETAPARNARRWIISSPLGASDLDIPEMYQRPHVRGCPRGEISRFRCLGAERRGRHEKCDRPRAQGLLVVMRPATGHRLSTAAILRQPSIVRNLIWPLATGLDSGLGESPNCCCRVTASQSRGPQRSSIDRAMLSFSGPSKGSTHSPLAAQGGLHGAIPLASILGSRGAGRGGHRHRLGCREAVTRCVETRVLLP